MGADRLERLHSNICSVLAQLHPLGLKSNLRNILPVLTPHLSGREWKELRLLYFTVGGSCRNKSSVQEWLTVPSAFCSSLLFLYVAASKIAGRPTVKEPKSQKAKKERQLLTAKEVNISPLKKKKKKRKLQVVTYTESLRASPSLLLPPTWNQILVGLVGDVSVRPADSRNNRREKQRGVTAWLTPLC